MTDLQQRTSWYSSATNQGQIRSGGPWSPEQLLSMHQWLSQALGHLKWNCWWNRWKSGVAEWQNGRMAGSNWAGHPAVCQFPEPCHELPPAQPELNKSINFISGQYKCKSHKTTCACIVPFAFLSAFLSRLCRRAFESWRAEEPRSWRTGELMPDMCTYMCGHM